MAGRTCETCGNETFDGQIACTVCGTAVPGAEVAPPVLPPSAERPAAPPTPDRPAPIIFPGEPVPAPGQGAAPSAPAGGGRSPFEHPGTSSRTPPPTLEPPRSGPPAWSAPPPAPYDPLHPNDPAPPPAPAPSGDPVAPAEPRLPAATGPGAESRAPERPADTSVHGTPAVDGAAGGLFGSGSGGQTPLPPPPPVAGGAQPYPPPPTPGTAQPYPPPRPPGPLGSLGASSGWPAQPNQPGLTPNPGQGYPSGPQPPPGYPPQGGQPGQPGYPPQPGYAPQPGFPGQAGFPVQAGYSGVIYHQRKSRKVPFIIGGVVVVLALIAGGLFFVNRDDGPAHPSAWDPRVKPLADWVAKARGLDFKQPVYVDFLTPAEYTKRSGAGDEGPTSAKDKKAEQDALDQQLGQLRALGLVEGKVDLEQAGNDLTDSGTLAYYSPEDERIFVRGTKLTPGLKVTIAHELTHVLQDQHFDLKRLAKLPTEQRGPLRAVGEGDARRIEHDYVESLSESDQKAVEAEETKESTDAYEKIDKTVPPAMIALFSAPYDFGTQFISVLHSVGGNDEINKAFETPPTSDEQIFNPFAYLEQDNPTTVKAPTPPDGLKVEDEDILGATAWYLILATRIDPRIALAAVDGWGGDRYVQYEQDGKVCIADKITGDTTKDTDEIEAAVGALPKQLVTTNRDDDELVATFCDPGEDSKLGIANDASKVMTLPVSRSALAAQVLEAGQGQDKAQCLSQAVVDRLTVDQLAADTATPEIDQAVAEAKQECN